MSKYLSLALGLVCLAVWCAGCSRGPARVKPPDVDPESAAEAAMEQYDTDKNSALSKGELEKCPGMLGAFAHYDADGNGSISRDEIVARITDLRKLGVGLARLVCDVTVNGRGLKDAVVAFEPESYLGEEVMPAQGVTNERGVAQIAIAAENLPEAQQHLKAIHYGTYKVRITHPSIKLPARYNSATTLGYESRPGDPYATFALKMP